MNNRRSNDASRSAEIPPRHGSKWWVTLAAVAIFATACGSSDGQAVDSADGTAEQTTESTTTLAPPKTTTTSDQPAPESSEPTTPPTSEESAVPGADPALTGSYNLDLTPLCNLAFVIADPALEACETSGGLEYLPALIRGTRTGTFDGTDFVAATLVVSPDGTYQFAGPAKFEGTVDGCGEGIVGYTAYGFGQFGAAASEAIYTLPAESNISTVAVSVAAEQTATSQSGRLVSGTYRCDETGEPPDAGVDSATAREMYGPTFAAVVPLCVLGSPLGSGDGTCETDGEHWFQSLRNTVQFTGSWEGFATFFGTNITSADGFYEEAGMFLFEGTVEGCGEGTVMLINEASGRNEVGLTYHRGYTPAVGNTGTLGVRADLTAVSTGPGGFEMQGTYSC